MPGESGVGEQLSLVTQTDPHMKAHHVGSLCEGNGLSPRQTLPLHGTGNGKHLHFKSPRV